MLKGIVTYKNEIISLEGIGDRLRSLATRSYESGFVLGVNEQGQKIFYDSMAGECVWPNNTEPTEQKENSLLKDPEPGAKDQTPKEPPAQAQEPDRKPESESSTPLTDNLLDLLNRVKSNFLVDTLSSIVKVAKFTKIDKGVLIELERPESEKDTVDTG